MKTIKFIFISESIHSTETIYYPLGVDYIYHNANEYYDMKINDKTFCLDFTTGNSFINHDYSLPDPDLELSRINEKENHYLMEIIEEQEISDYFYNYMIDHYDDEGIKDIIGSIDDMIDIHKALRAFTKERRNDFKKTYQSDKSIDNEKTYVNENKALWCQDLGDTVYTIENDNEKYYLKEWILKDLAEKYKCDDDEWYVKGCELWHKEYSGKEKLFFTYDSRREAEYNLFKKWEHDLDNSDEITYFYDKKQALERIEEMKEENIVDAMNECEQLNKEIGL